MRRVLKRLRKGIRTACLAAALATCWNVGQPAEALATTVTLEFSGTVSPTVNDLSHLFLIYATGYSSWFTVDVVKLGDFPAGQSTSFLVWADAEYDPGFRWYAAGLFGDISGGQYVEGLNGVTLAVDGTEGDSWDTYFSISEETLFAHLLSDQPGELRSRWYSWSGWHTAWDQDLAFTDSSILFDFSQASNNGQIYIESQIIPEPITILLFGTGGLIVVQFRRRED